MQFMVLTRRIVERFSEAEYSPERLEAEAEGVRRLYTEGIVRQIWLRGDERGACLIFEAEDEQQVRASLAKLPLFAAGMQEIVALTPLQPYRGFGPRS